MPLIYAIEEYVPFADTPEGVELHQWNADSIYHPVSQEIAENDEERGVFSLTNNDGEQIMNWTLIRKEWAKEATRSVKSTGPAHKDILGEVLALGDYVAYATTSAELGIGKVIAFTDKKVRLLAYNDAFRAITNSLKLPAGIIKIQPNKVSE